jgi:hypothetical protein
VLWRLGYSCVRLSALKAYEAVQLKVPHILNLSTRWRSAILSSHFLVGEGAPGFRWLRELPSVGQSASIRILKCRLQKNQFVIVYFHPL